MMLSKKALLLKPSPTLALAAKAKELAAQGKDIVSLTVGEPDWPTFEKASQAGIEAIKAGFTKYTAAAGTPDLKKAIAQQTNQQLGTQYSPAQVVVGAGAKFVIFTALQMLVNEGDEVLIPAPYWVSYPVMVELAGGVSKVLPTTRETNFKMTAAQLEKAITAKTKCLIHCSPSNPTGIAYSQKEIQEIAAVIKKYPQLIVISDDIYNRLNFKSADISAHLLKADPSLKDQVLVVNGASKSYSMTGWRVGWGLGPQALMTAMGDYMSQSTSNVNSITQVATLKAITECEPDLEKARLKLKEKYEWCEKQFSTLKYIELVPADGAFYLWVDVTRAFGKSFAGTLISDSKTLSQILLEKFYLAVVPGAEFGAEGYLRLSFAASSVELTKAFDRLREFEAKLS